MRHFKRFELDANEDNFIQTPIYGMFTLYSIIEKKIETHLRQYNLSSSKFNIMMIIKHEGGSKGISQVEIGKRLIVTASNMTKQIDKLIAEGFAERFAQQGDRRVNLIKISKHGSELLDEIWPGYVNFISNITNKLSLEDRKSFTHLLVKWFDELEA